MLESVDYGGMWDPQQTMTVGGECFMSTLPHTLPPQITTIIENKRKPKNLYLAIKDISKQEWHRLL